MENKQPHKRKKRAARALFDRRKVHKKQQTPLSPSLPIPSLSLAAPPSSSLESSIPEKWQVHRDGSETNYYHVVTTASAGTRIALCVTIHPDSTWNVYAYGKEVPVDGNPLFEGVPRCVTLSTTISASLCSSSKWGGTWRIYSVQVVLVASLPRSLLKETHSAALANDGSVFLLASAMQTYSAAISHLDISSCIVSSMFWRWLRSLLTALPLGDRCTSLSSCSDATTLTKSCLCSGSTSTAVSECLGTTELAYITCYYSSAIHHSIL